MNSENFENIITPADVLLDFAKKDELDTGESISGWMKDWAGKRRSDLFEEIQIHLGVHIDDFIVFDSSNQEESIERLIQIIKNY